MFYVSYDEKKRCRKVHVHVLGESQEKDICIFEEKNQNFYIDIHQAKDGKYLFITSTNAKICEIYVIDWFLTNLFYK